MKKNIYVLVGIFVLLVGVAYLLMNRPGENDIAVGNSQFLLNIDSLAVDKIEITSVNGKVAMEKKGGEWFLDEPVAYRANQASVTGVIHQAKNLAVKEIVSSNPDKRSIFQVDSTGTLVKIFQNGQEHSAFVVGKPTQSYSETYVRRDGSNDVVIVEGAVSFSFSKPAKDWRDKTVLNIPKENIKTISYQYTGENFALTLHDSVWMVGSAQAKATEVNSLLSSLSNLQADDFVDSVFSVMPKISAMVSVGDVQLRFSEIKDKDHVLVRSSASPQWFQLQGWHAKQILKHKKDLM